MNELGMCKQKCTKPDFQNMAKLCCPKDEANDDGVCKKCNIITGGLCCTKGT